VGDLAGQVVGRYQVESSLGAGGMGEVYLAQDTTLKRPVAIKRLDPQLSTNTRYRQRFLREAQHAARLNHQSIAAVHDVLEENGELLLVMEYVEGKTLSALDKPIDEQRFLETAIQCAEALCAAHHEGIIHRDIKPSNIMLTNDRLVKVLDFGIARQMPSSLQETMTQTEDAETERVQGTLAYMAPEALTGQDVDQHTDIFSLGIVFYEMLTGHHPFRDRTPAGTVDRILHIVPVPLRHLNHLLPLELERIVSKMLEKRPQERYATAED